jgi:hypothetical protein
VSDQRHSVDDIPEADRLEQLTPVEPAAPASTEEVLIPEGPPPEGVDPADWLDQQMEVDDFEDYPHES